MVESMFYIMMRVCIFDYGLYLLDDFKMYLQGIFKSELFSRQYLISKDRVIGIDGQSVGLMLDKVMVSSREDLDFFGFDDYNGEELDYIEELLLGDDFEVYEDNQLEVWLLLLNFEWDLQLLCFFVRLEVMKFGEWEWVYKLYVVMNDCFFLCSCLENVYNQVMIYYL